MKEETAPSTITKVGTGTEASFEERGETYFHINKVIDAYKTGVMHGERNFEKAFEELFERNVRDSVKCLNAIATHLRSIDIRLNKAYIQTGQWRQISFLLIVAENDFLDEKFYSVYDKLYSLEQEYNNKSLQVNVSFLPSSESFSEEAVFSDGFAELKEEV